MDEFIRDTLEKAGLSKQTAMILGTGIYMAVQDFKKKFVDEENTEPNNKV